MPPKKGTQKRTSAAGGGRGRPKKAAAPPSPPLSSPESIPSPPQQEPEPSPQPQPPSPKSPPASSQQSTSSSSSSSSTTSPFLNPSSLSPSLSTDLLTKRLQSVSTHLQSLKQDSPSTYSSLLPLCHHLTSPFLFNHPSRDVRLLVACSLADILRIFAPSPPFKDPDQLKSVFRFLTSQLEGLKNPQDTSYSRYYYLLENLSLVKAFTICFDMLEEEDASTIFTNLFTTLFSVMSNDHSPKMRSVTLALLEPIITDDDHLSFDLLDVILKHVLEPVKTSRKMAYQLAKDLIIKCQETLEVHITSLLNHILIHNKPEYEGISVSNHVYDLIYELHLISPSILQSCLPQLDYRLKSLDDQDRLNCVTLLAKMFSSSEASSSLDSHLYTPLWAAFLGRFNDISQNIRMTCVKHCSHLLLKHPSIRRHVVECLSSRQLDPDEHVRLEVVKQIVTTASNSPSSDGGLQDGWKFVSGNEELLNILKGRCLDKKGKVRVQALQALGQIYKQFLEEGEEDSSPPSWIHNKILEGYYIDSLEDKIVIERIFNTCLLPWKLPVKERMLQLVYLFATFTPMAQKAFIEVQKNMLSARHHLLGLLKVLQLPVLRKEDTLKLMNSRISSLSKLLPDPLQTADHINSLVNELKLKPSLSQALQLICDSTADCQSVGENVNKALKSLGISKSSYYATIKTLLERCSSVLIDHHLILSLLQFTHSLLSPNSPSSSPILFPKSLPFPPTSPLLLQKTSLLLSSLIFLFPLQISSPKVPPPSHTLPPLKSLISLLLSPSLQEPSSSTLLSSLAHLGTTCQSPLTATSSLKSLLSSLTSHCLNLLETGSPRQAKMSLRLLSTNHPPPQHPSLFSSILSTILIPSLSTCSTSPCATSITSLGHLSLFTSLPPTSLSSLKSLITSKLLSRSGLLLSPPRKPSDSTKNPGKTWVDRSSLPHTTYCMLLALKAVTNWITTQKTDLLEVASKFFNMLTMFIESGGGGLEKTNEKMPPFSPSEHSWLRLQAGICFLKMVKVKGVGDQFTAFQYCTLAKLMIDPVDQVRFRFHQKLHKGLSRGFPDKCLPVDFLGFYCLAAFEPERKERQLMKKNFGGYVKVRREWVQVLKRSVSEEKQREQMVGILPEYGVAYAVLLLTVLPEEGNEDEGLVERLGEARKGMNGMLEGLMGGKEGGWMYGFFRRMMQGVKNRVNGVDPRDEGMNRRMWGVSEVVMDMVEQKCAGRGERGDYPGEVRVPGLYFKRKGGGGEEEWRNEESYLPEGFLEGLGGKKRKSLLKARNVKEGKGKKREREEETEENGGDEGEGPPDAKQSRVGEGDGGEGEGSEASNLNAVAATPEVEEVEVEENEENNTPEKEVEEPKGRGPLEKNGGKRGLREGMRRSARRGGTLKESEEEATPTPPTTSESPEVSPPKKKGRGRTRKSGGGEEEGTKVVPVKPKLRLRRK